MNDIGTMLFLDRAILYNITVNVQKRRGFLLETE